MPPAPGDFPTFLSQLLDSTRNLAGFLTEREREFLPLLAAFPTAKGEILEIGSYKGLSTVLLAKAAVWAGGSRIVAVDPLRSRPVTALDPKGKPSALKDFQANVRNAGVDEAVEFHQMTSAELARVWDKPIRLLWIDGDHTYPGTKLDFALFSKFLVKGAVVAFHDALHLWEGPIRVFMEDVLLSGNFGPAGFCGSIAWSQYLPDTPLTSGSKRRKMKLYRQLAALIPFVALVENGHSRNRVRGLQKLRLKLLKSRLPHSAMSFSRWLKAVTFFE